MKKKGRSFRTEQGTQLNLSSRGVKDILPPYHQINIFEEIIDDNSKIVSPVFVPVANQKITALHYWILLPWAEEEVGK